MPRVWGSWSATSSSGARYRVGMDYSRSGTRVTVSQYVFESAFSIGKSVTLQRTGGLSGSYSVNVSTSGGVVSMGRGGSVTGRRGSSVTIGGRVTNILHGLTCSVSTRVNIPALPPSTPSAPSVSNITSRGARITWSAPANNGASITQYGYRAERGGDFQEGGYSTSRSATFTDLEPNTRYGARVRAQNSAGWSGFSSFRYFTTDKTRPNSPTNMKASRVNDERVTLSWTRRHTTGGPYESQLIRRRVNGGPWGNLATVSAGATSYTDNSTKYGNRYEYAVRASNSAGVSSFVYSPQVYMRPWSPPTPTAQKSGDNIKVTWGTSSSDYVTGYRIYDSQDGGSPVQVGSTTSRSWTHVDPDPSVTHQYRVSSVYSGLEGNQSNPSNTVQLQAPPLAPTLLEPGDGAVLPNDEDITFRWRHNPVDTTDQTAYELGYRIDGGEVTVLTGTTASSRTLPALDQSAEIRWNVRTKGDDPEFGPWVTAREFTLASVPSVAIQEPSTDTLDAAYVTVEWDYANDDADSQRAWQAQLLDEDDNLVEQASGTVATEYAFEHRMGDAETYRIRVRVRAGSGLWSDWDETTFTTDFPLPLTIEPDLEWDRDHGAVMITLADEPLLARDYAWTGAEGESTSEETVEGQVTRTNYVKTPRPRPGLDLSEWFPASGTAMDERGPGGLRGFYRLEGTGEEIIVAMNLITIPLQAGDTVYASMAVRCSEDTTALMVIGDVLSEPVELQAGEWARLFIEYAVEDDRDDISPRLFLHDGQQTLPLPEDALLDVTQGYVSKTSGDYFDGGSASRAAPDAVEVERKDQDGDWVLIGSGLDPQTSITDHTPRLLGDVTYRVVSRTVLPSEAVGPEVAITWENRRTDPSVFVNGGSTMATVCTAEGGQVDDQPTIEQTSIRFAGQPYPTAVFGRGEEREVSFQGTILHGYSTVSTREDWVALLQMFSVVCYRDLSGRKVYGILTLGFSQDRIEETVDITVERTRYLEGVDRVPTADLEQDE